MTVQKIILDYPIRPISRPTATSAGGKLMINMINQSAGHIENVIDGIEDLHWLRELSSDYIEGSSDPYWNNGWFPPLDGASLAAILKASNPATFLEIGSGNSTKFARKTIDEHGLRTRIISIDPHPRAEIDSICDDVIRSGLEDADLSAIDNLEAGDILFMDSSHRSFMNSDVTVFFLEILPRLKHGVIYGLHDIFLPGDYVNEWADRFYNEQYLLAAYLLGGANGDTIIFPARFASETLPYRQRLIQIGGTLGLKDFPDDGAGGFWLKRQ